MKTQMILALMAAVFAINAAAGGSSGATSGPTVIGVTVEGTPVTADHLGDYTMQSDGRFALKARPQGEATAQQPLPMQPSDLASK